MGLQKFLNQHWLHCAKPSSLFMSPGCFFVTLQGFPTCSWHPKGLVLRDLGCSLRRVLNLSERVEINMGSMSPLRQSILCNYWDVKIQRYKIFRTTALQLYTPNVRRACERGGKKSLSSISIVVVVVVLIGKRIFSTGHILPNMPNVLSATSPAWGGHSAELLRGSGFSSLSGSDQNSKSSGLLGSDWAQGCIWMAGRAPLPAAAWTNSAVPELRFLLLLLFACWLARFLLVSFLVFPTSW